MNTKGKEREGNQLRIWRSIKFQEHWLSHWMFLWFPLIVIENYKEAQTRVHKQQNLYSHTIRWDLLTFWPLLTSPIREQMISTLNQNISNGACWSELANKDKLSFHPPPSLFYLGHTHSAEVQINTGKSFKMLKCLRRYIGGGHRYIINVQFLCSNVWKRTRVSTSQIKSSFISTKPLQISG